jgi:hypothetical protein
MLENPVLQTVSLLAALFAPFMAHSMAFTQYLKELTGAEATEAKLLASLVSLLGAALIVVAYIYEASQVYVGIYFFLTSAFAVPGGYDLIKNWAGRIGNHKPSLN